MLVRCSNPTVAVFDALDDQRQLTTATLRVLGCRVHTLIPGDNGLQDVADQLERDGPFDVVLWDVPHALRAPCEEFGDLCERGAFATSGVVITTTDRDRLEPMLDAWAGTFAILARPYTFTILMQAINAATTAGGLAAVVAERDMAVVPVARRMRPVPAM